MSPHERESRRREGGVEEGRERRLVAVGLVLLGLVVVAAFAFLTGRSTAAREAQNADALALEPPAPDPWARPPGSSVTLLPARPRAPDAPAPSFASSPAEPGPVASQTAYRREEWPRDAPASAPAGGTYVKGYVRKDGTYVRPHVRHRPSR